MDFRKCLEQRGYRFEEGWEIAGEERAVDIVKGFRGSQEETIEFVDDLGLNSPRIGPVLGQVAGIESGIDQAGDVAPGVEDEGCPAHVWGVQVCAGEVAVEIADEDPEPMVNVVQCVAEREGEPLELGVEPFQRVLDFH